MTNTTNFRTTPSRLLLLLALLCAACAPDPDTSSSGVPVDQDDDDDDDDEENAKDSGARSRDAAGPSLRVDAGDGTQGARRDASNGPPARPKDAGRSDAALAGDATVSANEPDGAVDGASAPDAATTVDVACDPADKGMEATPINGIGTGSKPAGMFATAVEKDPGIADQTILRPEPLGAIKHPILTWGNGGCQKSNSGFMEFLLQFAAEGILVIADGAPSASGSSNQDGSQLIKAIDWAEKENERPCSKYYHKLDLTKIAVSGQSCGGLMVINASDDKRVSVSMPMNSGLMARNRTLYNALHAPMAIINGGSSDIAYANGNADFEAIDNIPIMNANLPVGHGGTYRQDNGGEMGKFALAWLRWHLLNDLGASGKGMFIGDSCGFCDSEWTMMWKMKPL